VVDHVPQSGHFLTAQDHRQFLWDPDRLHLGHHVGAAQRDVKEEVSPVIVALSVIGDVPASTMYNRKRSRSSARAVSQA